jgi:hypothetical protein
MERPTRGFRPRVSAHSYVRETRATPTAPRKVWDSGSVGFRREVGGRSWELETAALGRSESVSSVGSSRSVGDRFAARRVGPSSANSRQRQRSPWGPLTSLLLRLGSAARLTRRTGRRFADHDTPRAVRLSVVDRLRALSISRARRRSRCGIGRFERSGRDSKQRTCRQDGKGKADREEACAPTGSADMTCSKAVFMVEPTGFNADEVALHGYPPEVDFVLRRIAAPTPTRKQLSAGRPRMGILEPKPSASVRMHRRGGFVGITYRSFHAAGAKPLAHRRACAFLRSAAPCREGGMRPPAQVGPASRMGPLASARGAPDRLPSRLPGRCDKRRRALSYALLRVSGSRLQSKESLHST